MPHIILEHPEDCLSETQVNEALRCIHSSAATSDLFDKCHIRTRAYSFKQFTHGDHDKAYIHIQARIKSGRDIDKKKKLSDSILQGLQHLGLPVAAITIEVVDMKRESYSKYSEN